MDWNQDSYLTRYPIPPRNNQPFVDEDAKNGGFEFVGRERYTIPLTPMKRRSRYLSYTFSLATMKPKTSNGKC